MTKKIHFINRIDRLNVGDVTCCPLSHYAQYFLQFNLVRHDLDFIDWSVIDRGDIVILGGGGILNVTASFNTHINTLLDRCETVIGWSVGHNTHNERWGQGQTFEPIDFRRFALIAIRDFRHPSGLPSLPCPSGLAPELGMVAEPKRRFGYIAHKDLPQAFEVDEYVDNSFTLERVAHYIAESEIVVTYSYHMAYWAQLMGRKAIVVDKFSEKFDYFEYPVAFVETAEAGLSLDALEAAAERTSAPRSARAEARVLNDAFFAKVRAIVEARGFAPGTEFQAVYQLTEPKSWNARNALDLIGRRFDDLARRHDGLAGRHDDLARFGAALERRLEGDAGAIRGQIEENHRAAHQRMDREGEIIHNRITEREAEILRRLEEEKRGLTALIEDLMGHIVHLQRRVDDLEARAPASPSAPEAEPRAN